MYYAQGTSTLPGRGREFELDFSFGLVEYTQARVFFLVYGSCVFLREFFHLCQQMAHSKGVSKSF